MEFLYGSDGGGTADFVRIRIQNGKIRLELKANSDGGTGEDGSLNGFTSFRTNTNVFSDGTQTSWTHILVTVTNNGGTNATTGTIHINGSNPVTITTGNSDFHTLYLIHISEPTRRRGI